MANRPRLAAVLLAGLLAACTGGDGTLSPASPTVPGSPTLPRSPTPTADAPSEIRKLELAIAQAVNERRQEHGLDPLTSREDLAAVARDYSERMLEEDFFDHVGPQGGNVADRVRDAGITFTAVGENLYLGEGPIDHVEAAVSGWMGSPDHRENILREVFTHTGVGMAREGNDVRVTQIFLTGP